MARMSSAKKGAAQAAPTLDELAELIQEESRAGEEEDLARALRLGAMLRQARARVPRGTWKTWVAANYAGSLSNADRQRQIADPANSARVRSCKSVREALGAIKKSKTSPTPPKKKPREAGKRLRKMREVDESKLRNARINIMKMVGILEGIDLPELDLRGGDPDTITEIHEELSILAEWLDQSLDAVGAEMNDLQKQATIRKLREGMNGRTDAEVATMRRLAEKLERKRQAIR